MSRSPALSPRLALRARAAVVVDFELSRLVSDADDVDEVLDFLDADCDRVRTPTGEQRWSLKDARRRQTLPAIPVTELRQLRAGVSADDSAPLQAALDRSLRAGWREAALDRLPLADARALSVVADWWAGARPGVPTAERMRVLVDRLSLFADVRAMAGDHFVGRQALRAELREHFGASTARPFVVHGLGGIGKSALVAKHIVWAIDDAEAKVALLDFDDSTLNPTSRRTSSAGSSTSSPDRPAAIRPPSTGCGRWPATSRTPRRTGRRARRAAAVPTRSTGSR